MNKLRFLFYPVLFLFSFQSLLLAQQTNDQSEMGDSPDSLQTDLKEGLKNRAIDKIHDFMYYIALVAQPDLSKVEKTLIKEVGSKLFINEGEGVSMEVSFKSPINGEISVENRPMITYFNNLMEIKDTIVEFDHDLYVISWKDWEQNTNSVYKSSVVFKQVFNSESYHDTTLKSINVELRWSNVLGVNQWAILLSDVTVVSTK